MSLLKQPQISDSVVALAFHYFLRAVTSIEVLRISSGQYRFFFAGRSYSSRPSPISMHIP
jgi:hypothetical protein